MESRPEVARRSEDCLLTEILSGIEVHACGPKWEVVDAHSLYGKAAGGVKLICPAHAHLLRMPGIQQGTNTGLVTVRGPHYCDQVEQHEH